MDQKIYVESNTLFSSAVDFAIANGREEDELLMVVENMIKTLFNAQREDDEFERMGGLDGYNKRNEAKRRANPFTNECFEKHVETLDELLKRFWADMPEAEQDGIAEYVHGRVKHIMGE